MLKRGMLLQRVCFDKANRICSNFSVIILLLNTRYYEFFSYQKYIVRLVVRRAFFP